MDSKKSVSASSRPNQATAKSPVVEKRKPTPHTRGRSMDIARSKSISRFAPANNHRSKPVSSQKPDIAPAVKHPTEVKAHSTISQKLTSTRSVPRPASAIKQEAIKQALDKAQPAAEPSKKSFIKRHHRFFSLASIGLIIILLAGFLVYLNLPVLSVRVAAARAGIEATYPEYTPDGYRLAGPVSYSDNQVIINFSAVSGKTSYSIVQSKSSWDSTAVRDNLVRAEVGDNYITTKERGLTIYTYNGSASWVNGGILFSISSDAPLSSDQIRRIAVSL